MDCCSSASATRASASQNPSFHVNYTKGMVLGVDDFTQEFAYLAGRDQWIVRELSGAGILRGLAITAEDTADGPRVRVARGSAATPSGKLVCIPADQCGALNAWLAAKVNADAVTRKLGTGSPPAPPPPTSPPALLTLFLTLCYADCLTAPVPIPGEPCRSDDALMAPSRVADDFRIELRLIRPDSEADDGMRAFVAWLRQVPVATSSPPPLDDEAEWLAALQAAAPSWYPSIGSVFPSAPLSPPVSPPLPLVSAARWPAFIGFAFRFWATEIVARIGPICGDTARPDADCLLLAQIDVPVLFAGGVPVGAWQVAGQASAIRIEATAGGFVAPAKLLQEWLLGGPAEMAAAAPAPALPQALDIGAAPLFAGLTLTGAVQVAFTTTAADLTLDGSHYCVACSTGVALTLPKATPALRGRVYVAKALTADCKIAAAATDTIEGVPTLALPQNAATTIICDGDAAWLVIASAA